MNSEKSKLAHTTPPVEGDRRQPALARSEVPRRENRNALDNERGLRPEVSTPRGRNERLLKTIAELLGIPESGLMPSGEPLGPGSRLGELDELVQTFLALDDPCERTRIVEVAREAARRRNERS